MKRRNFVQKTTAGVIGFNLIGTNANAFSLLDKAGVQEWLRQWAKATNLKKRSVNFLSEEALINCISQVSFAQARLGFRIKNADVFFYPKHDYCLMPLYSSKKTLGVHTMLLCVLTKMSNGTWKHVGTLNSYELEALALASASLNHHDQLEEFLLPYSLTGKVKSPHGITTEKGMVKIETRIRDNEAKTNIAVSTTELTFNENFTSTLFRETVI